jgi:uncharacterized protein (TIGR03437 family)
MRRVTPVFVGVPCLLATAFPTHAQSTPSIFPGGIVNAASYAAAAPLAPGSIAAAFGNFLLTAPAVETGPALPTNLGGLSLQLSGGQLAPLFYASGGEVNFQVPWELAGATQMSVSALLNNQPGASQTVNIAPFAPGIFSLNSQGTGQGAILDSSYKVVDASNPATAGSSYIQIYATGLGAVSNQPASGSPALAVPLSQTTATPTVTIGDAPATVLFSGLAPTLVGVYQINALVPAGSAIGVAVPVSISIGGVSVEHRHHGSQSATWAQSHSFHHRAIAVFGRAGRHFLDSHHHRHRFRPVVLRHRKRSEPVRHVRQRQSTHRHLDCAGSRRRGEFSGCRGQSVTRRRNVECRQFHRAIGIWLDDHKFHRLEQFRPRCAAHRALAQSNRNR